VVHETQAIEQFCDAMFDKDIDVDLLDIVADGKLHRVHDKGDGKNVKDAWYILHVDDRPAGKFGHNGKYGYDVSFPWSMKVQLPKLSAEEKRLYREKMEADRAQRDSETAARHAQAAEQANRIWDAATPVEGDAHPYLQRKGIQSYGLRVGRWEKMDPETGEVSLISDNALLIPIWSRKVIHSLQAILPDAKKLGRDKDYLSGANKHGHYYSFGKPVEHEGKSVILIVEGYATGASLHAATGHAVIVAFDAPNLLPVAEAMRAGFPDATLIVCADNDQWTLKPVANPGLTRAREVREAVGALVAVPQFDPALGIANEAGKVKGPNDFNDLAQLEGIDAVRQVIADTLNPPAPVIVEAPAPVPVDISNIPPWDDVPGIESMTAPDLPIDEMPGFIFVESPPPAASSRDDDYDDLDDSPVHNKYFRFLGYKDGVYYIFNKKSREVQEITAAKLSENALIELADPNWWELYFPNGKKEGMNKRAAVSFVIRAAVREGIYDNSRRRGRGAWIDEGRIVYHHGGRLSVDGKPIELEDIQSRFAYGIDIAMPEPADTPLSDADGQKLFKLATQFRWTMPGSAALLAGFVLLAPICGALNWRPHIWLTGGAGCGKSTVLNDYVYPLMNGSALFAQGNSSEAGIRQTLHTDARPVLFDESESNEEGDIRRIQNVLSLIRQASTESEARTLKGTAGGAAMSFHIRSMFCLASIQVAIKQQADVERLTVMSLRPKREDDNAAENWNTLRDELYLIKRDETIAPRLMRRALDNLPVIRQNIKTFATAAAKRFGSQRDGDQYGTLLAGCWSLMSTEVATPEQAQETIDSFDWSEHREHNETDEAQGALGALMSALIPHQGARYSVGELIAAAAGPEVGVVTKSDADALLGRHGMRVRETVVLVANKSEQLRSLVSGTPFEADLRGALLRVKGATRNDHKPAKFAGIQAKCITIPLAPLLANDAELEGQF
jgi:putative DNA primase/helicase